MELNFAEIENKWKAYWQNNAIYTTEIDLNKPKCYVLDMFPYPSGSGLHVGHPLGYIASDIYSRYKRMQGFNVLHPMGFDAFGLPAEQYAVETGRHPADTTTENIFRYKSQLDNIGFCYDWSREVNTASPDYYQWTQWIFLQLFNSWYNRATNKAESIESLIEILNSEGNINHPLPGQSAVYTVDQWLDLSAYAKEKILMGYRLAYQSHSEVNWCEALGTVLANDEVINGESERGGHPVIKRKMKQWFLRITEYADRLLEGLQTLDWSDSLKEIQINWIGKSKGAEILFDIENSNEKIKVFTTRPDTIFGASFMVLAPELDMVLQICDPEKKEEIEKYIHYVKSRSERERMAEVKKITGIFTGAYALHPFTNARIPIWISEYVLAGYGTGSIMAVPAGDERDFKFAKHFDIEIKNIFGDLYDGTEAVESKQVRLTNSDFLNGMTVEDAQSLVLQKLEDTGRGIVKTNYRFRDAGLSRQRYWGEPFPIKYNVMGDKDTMFNDTMGEDKLDIAVALSEDMLPLILPEVSSFKPTGDGQSPLTNNEEWVANRYETDTMPGYAGSSWYFIRYTDPQNKNRFASEDALNYWGNVDVYFGGAEHAVGHLLYARMWTKVLFDLGHIPFDEPFKKLINQGMIQGVSKIAHRIKGENKFVSSGLASNYETDPIHVFVSLVDGEVLDIEQFKAWREDFADAEFVLENGLFKCDSVVEKMSKRYHNVINPDDMVSTYGADTFRLYEMFLGPLEMSKPWDTKGIEGVARFFRKLWRLIFNEEGDQIIVDEPLNAEEQKLKHSTIKKIIYDCEHFNFNTSVSQFMICVNQMHKLSCHKKEMIETLALLLAPFAPHIAEEIYQSVLDHKGSVFNAKFPEFDLQYLTENSKLYPIAVNGKPRAEMEFALDDLPETIEAEVLQNPSIIKHLDGKSLKKFIFVKGKMINLVVG